jgi:pimeloyl-ACP methyl ester carboxylesterase
MNQSISQDVEFLEAECGNIQYADFGKGPAILIVHGSGGGFDQGKYFANLINENYRWIAPSRFGFLGSPIPSGANSSLQADYYACLLDYLSIDQVGVIGISMGGPSALLFARNYPERTRSLALISAASHAISQRPWFISGLFKLFLNDFVFSFLANHRPDFLLSALGVPLEVQEQLSTIDKHRLNNFLNSIYPMGARRDGQLLEQRMSEIDSEVIQEIDAPTIVLHARDDTLVPFDHAKLTTGLISDAELVTMDSGGHLALMLSTNSDALDRLREFLLANNR